MNNKLTLSFFILAIAYLASLSFTPYAGQFLLKVLPIVCLLAMVLSSLQGKLKWLMAGALLASGTGDVLLALPIGNSFILGLGAFLIAQLTYAITYFSHKSVSIDKLNKAIVIAIAAFALLIGGYILPAANEMLLPVSIYLSVIALMAVAAWLSKFGVLVGFGALSFLASDAILATSIFKTPLPWSSFLVMFTYYLAQYLMVVGVIRSQQRS